VPAPSHVPGAAPADGTATGVAAGVARVATARPIARAGHLPFTGALAAVRSG